MAAPVDSLEGKLEASLVALLADAGLEDVFGAGSVILFFGHEFEEQVGPNINVTCFGGPEIPFHSGNYLLRTRITIKSPADREPNETVVSDPRERHRQLVQLVREAVLTTEVEATLTGLEDDFTCWIVIDGGSDSGVDGRFFWTGIDLECDCVRADFAAD